jgi:hypothetical protein
VKVEQFKLKFLVFVMHPVWCEADQVGSVVKKSLSVLLSFESESQSHVRIY